MKNDELLDMIGDVNEDYVRAADDNVVRPRFRWQALAASAACAALVLCAYPILRTAQSHDSLCNETMEPPLHAYTVVEGGALATYDENIGKIQAGSGDVSSEAAAGGADVGGMPEQDEDSLVRDGTIYDSWQDVPVQEAATTQYDLLCQHIDMDEPPEWFAGAWLSAPDQSARLAVAIVNGFRTPELEAQIVEWTGNEEVVFQNAKYSKSHLDDLMQPIGAILDGAVVSCGFGVDVMENCLTVDIYSDEEIPTCVLAELARLDPDGDAIQVRVFVGTLSLFDKTAAKDPVPNAVSTPVPGGQQEFPAEEAMPAYTENGQPAQYDTLPRKLDDLPQTRFDLIYEGES